MLVVSLFAALTGTARAQDEQRARDPLGRRAQYPETNVIVLPIGPAPLPASYEVEQNGEDVSALQAASLTDAGVGVGIVYAVDTSNAMGREQAMDNVKAALTAGRGPKAANQQIAIVSFGVSPRVVSNFTTNAASLTGAIATLRPSLERPEAVERDGMRTALALLDDTTLQGNVVVVQAGGDDASVSTQGQVEGDLLESNVMVFGLGLDTGDLASGDLQGQVSTTHGTYAQLDDMSKIADSLAVIGGTISSQVQLTYQSDADATTIDLVVTAGDQSADATFNPGSFTVGGSLSPDVYNPPLAGGPGFLSGSTGQVPRRPSGARGAHPARLRHRFDLLP